MSTLNSLHNTIPRVLLFVGMLFIITSTSGQEKVYLDKDRNETSQGNASFYRYYIPKPRLGNIYQVKTFYLNDTLASVLWCKTKTCGYKEFNAVWYHPNGTKKKEKFYEKGKVIKEVSWYENGNKKYTVNYVKGKKEGTWKKWNLDGSLRLEGKNIIDYNLPRHKRSLFINYWDRKSGEQTLVNGNGYVTFYHSKEDTLIVSSEGKFKNGFKIGEWIGYSETGQIKYKEKYNGNGVRGISWDESNNEYSYKRIRRKPRYEKGKIAFLKMLDTRLKETNKVSIENIEDEIDISFTVDKNGKIIDIEVTHNNNHEIAQECINFMSNYSGFIPGKERGQNKKMKMFLPLTFDL